MGPVIYTGNNVKVYVNGKAYGFVQTVTISRSANRSPQYVVGTNLWVDAPATQATVTVQMTCLVPIGGPNTLAGGNVPTGSLAAEVEATTYPITIYDLNGNLLYGVSNAFYNDDAVTVPGTAVLSYNLSWTAQDTTQFTN